MTSLPLALLFLALAAGKGADLDISQRLGPHLTVLGIQLQRDTLPDAAKRLGKAEVRHNERDAAASASSACYQGADGTVLAFISVSEAGDGRYLITDFHLATKADLINYSPIVPEAPVAATGRPRCARSSKVSRATATAGGLRLGMTVASVKGLLGPPAAETADSMAYSGHSDSLDGTVRLELQVADGVIVGIIGGIDLL